MTFAHDTEMALSSAAALVNTDPGTGSGEDTLRTREQLVRLPRRGGLVRQSRRRPGRAGRRTVAAAAPARAVAARGGRSSCAAVNEVLLDSQALPQLVDHDDIGWHIHAVPQDAPLATRMLVEAAMAFIDVIRSRGARPAEVLRRRRLRQRRGRPVAQPLQAVLRGRLRQPRERARLPGPAARLATLVGSALHGRGLVAPVPHDVPCELPAGRDGQHHGDGERDRGEPPDDVAGHLEGRR